MSQNAIIVCEISATAADAHERAAAARRLLVDRRIIAVNEARDELWQPSEFRAGAGAIDVAPDFAHEHERNLANNGVDFICERTLHHPVENYEPPLCPACGVPRDDGLDALAQWLEGAEPIIACARCGASHALGDWKGTFSAYVAEVAVRFNNWPPIAESFLRELGRTLGPRWRVVYART